MIKIEEGTTPKTIQISTKNTFRKNREVFLCWNDWKGVIFGVN